MKKDGVVLGDTAQCHFEGIRELLADTTPSTLRSPPLLQKGNIRDLFANPSKKGELNRNNSIISKIFFINDGDFFFVLWWFFDVFDVF